jgi:hypothetical protein
LRKYQSAYHDSCEVEQMVGALSTNT